MSFHKFCFLTKVILAALGFYTTLKDKITDQVQFIHISLLVIPQTAHTPHAPLPHALFVRISTRGRAHWFKAARFQLNGFVRTRYNCASASDGV